MAEEKLIGKISHFYNNISVGIIELDDSLKNGDKIHIKGSATDFEQVVDSMQIEHSQVEEAKAGDAIGLRLNEKVREGDQVYKIVE